MTGVVHALLWGFAAATPSWSPQAPTSPTAALPTSNAADARTPAAKHPTLPSSLPDYFAGHWRGTGRFVATGKPLESGFTITRAAAGEAVLIEHEEVPPAHFAFSALLSVDSRSGELIMMMASNNTGGARLFHAAGSWTDGQLVFTTAPELSAWFAEERMTLTRVSDGAFRYRYEMSRDHGATWRTGDEQLFVRQTAAGSLPPPQ